MLHLKSFTLKRPNDQNAERFPFTIPAIKTLDHLAFTTPVTFFVGENGSGKSTLLEALVLATGLPMAGSESGERDATLAHVRPLASALRLSWQGARTRKGFCLRAEDFFGYAKRLNQSRAEMESDLQQLAQEYAEAGRSRTAAGLASMPYRRELHELRRRYGEGLDARSHGENFVAFFQARFVPKGLYLLDEPEAPLSPLRQLSFLALLKQMVAQDAQFIIATHSPLMLALPDATIISFDQTPLTRVSYESLEHVRLTRQFLNHPQQFLKDL